MTASSPSTDARRADDAVVQDLSFRVVLALFVLSGLTGLVAQLCFSKYLTYVVGSTAYAVSAVLAAFMTGLALGAHLGGRFSGRIQRPLLVYGALELVVAAAIAATPLAFAALTPLYVSMVHAAPGSLLVLNGLRWLLAVLVVIVPTTAMGATLPVLSRALPAATPDQLRSRERRLGALYALNTLGGALGSLSAAYLVLPAAGLSGTLLVAAGISAGVGLTAVALGRRHALSPGEAPPELSAIPRHDDAGETSEPPLHSEPTGGEAVLLVALAFGSGALVFACEVVFTHLLALVIGNSAYAFGLILAAFLVWLFAGALLAPRAHARFGDSALPYGLAAAGLGLLVTLPVWDQLPLLFAGAGKLVESFAGREALRAVAAFCILALPTTLMGLTFPLLLQRVARYARVGQLVGRLTSVNTIGAVVGSLVTGYFVLPWLGSQSSLMAVAAVLVLAGLVTPRTAGGRAKRVMTWLAASSLLALLVMPRWDLMRLTSGTNVYFDGHAAPGEILLMREDVHGGVTTVVQSQGVTTLYTNGKFQGNTGWEMQAQRFFAHYPSLFVDDFDRALVIGLGTGTTLGTIAAYPWKDIDVVEISPAIVEAARQHFRGPNRGALGDPRVDLRVGDGRNFLLVEDERYDMISMELSSIWFAGAASLYSKQYYALVARHLEPGGIFQQWVQLHHVYPRDLATILNTLRGEFRHVALFFGGGQGVLVASQQPLVADAARLQRLAARPEIQGVIPEGRTLRSLLGDVLLVDSGLDAYIAATARQAGVPVGELVSTDDNLYLEYRTPRGNVLPWSAREELVADMRRYRDPSAIRAMIEP